MCERGVVIFFTFCKSFFLLFGTIGKSENRSRETWEACYSQNIISARLSNNVKYEYSLESNVILVTIDDYSLLPSLHIFSFGNYFLLK